MIGWPGGSGAIVAMPASCGRICEKGLAVSLRTVERAVAGLRQALQAEARAMMRFETPPGHQLQIDFGGDASTDQRRARARLPVCGDPGLLEAHLEWWMREIADQHIHGTTGERFERAEVPALRRLDGRSPFRQMRELVRRVQADATIELDTNAYSVPWRLIGETVQVVVAGSRVSIRHRGVEIAVHARPPAADSAWPSPLTWPASAAANRIRRRRPSPSPSCCDRCRSMSQRREAAGDEPQL
jgi:hypothetical protein